MGLDWFEMDVNMPDDQKCNNLAARLKQPLAFGYVVRLYAYCYRLGTDRFDGLGAVGSIEEAAKWKGKTGALVTALIEEKFLDREGEALVVHGVGKRLGPTLEKMARDAERQRERRAEIQRTYRGRSRGQPTDGPGDVGGDLT